MKYLSGVSLNCIWFNKSCFLRAALPSRAPSAHLIPAGFHRCTCIRRKTFSTGYPYMMLLKGECT